MGNAHSGRRPTTGLIELTPTEKDELERLSRLRTAAYREVVRARALLMAATGGRNRTIAKAFGIGESSVYRWRQEFLRRRMGALRDRPRPGRRRRFSPLSTSSSGSHCLPEAR